MFTKRGFTLVEILFVVMIAAGVLAFAIPAYKKTQARAKYERSLGALDLLGNALVSLQRECTLKGINISYCRPADGMSAVTFGGRTAADYENTTLNAALTEAFGNSAKFMDVLANFDFLRKNAVPIGADYDLYITYFPSSYSGSDTPCSGLCNGENTLACMCATSGDPCYLGAKYQKDGSVVRLYTNACSGLSEE